VEVEEEGTRGGGRRRERWRRWWRRRAREGEEEGQQRGRGEQSVEKKVSMVGLKKRAITAVAVIALKKLKKIILKAKGL